MSASFDDIVSLVRRHVKQAEEEPTTARIDRREAAPKSYDDGDEYLGVGVDGILAASGKLLAVNRGDATPDARDSWAYKRVMTPDKLLRERIRMDADRSGRKLMRVLSRRKSLDSVSPFHFDNYATGMLLGNPLSSPLEEINPMHIVEQLRRITLMGPGGIGSSQAITPSMQAVHSSQFGFISPVEGPECFDARSEVYTLRGWVPWPEVEDSDLFACRIAGRLEWHKADRIVRADYDGPLLVGEHETIRMAVTPGHRVLNTRDKRYRVDLAFEVFGKSIHIPIRHEPYVGDISMLTFSLPELPITNPNQKVFAPFEIEDWCAYMGWWLSEGNAHSTPPGRVSHIQHRAVVTQCAVKNAANYAEIQALCRKMGICDGDNGKTFGVGAKQFASYFAQWENGCYDKWIPEELQHAPVFARERLLDALLKGDGRYTQKRHCYCTVSERLARDVERLAIGLGYTAFIRVEPDAREHVTTTNYVVSLHRQQHRQLVGRATEDKRSGKVYGDNWREEAYSGKVYCATVPGGLLHVRGKKSTSGFWSGNSEKAGIDVRLAWNARIGSDGRVYQQFLNKRTGQMDWVSPEELEGKTVKLPD
jgi:hypothetical protein